MTYESLNQKAQFVLILNAHVSHGVFPSTSNVCVKVDVVHGPDWTVLAGQRQAVSATSVRSDQGHKFVFDLPYHLTFSSTNPFRWPQLVISCYGTDFLGHDVSQGYGCVRVPTTPGSHTREVACFTPEPSSMFQSVVGFLWGRRPEFVEPTIIASAEGRHVTRVNTNGKITINMDVILKDTKRQGFGKFIRRFV
ncbi:hypothetical protein WR25_00584 [Diploscapter pachys]|uniref:B9 domain-containing protein 1 n=1 Tax=Diploscapter pachys TaxID=2018661 RepID=A0A2A2JK44_9BILA|nr:hypothetical protein WR25_00584 [Diploscapter pachys]